MPRQLMYGHDAARIKKFGRDTLTAITWDYIHPPQMGLMRKLEMTISIQSHGADETVEKCADNHGFRRLAKQTAHGFARCRKIIRRRGSERERSLSERLTAQST